MSDRPLILYRGLILPSYADKTIIFIRHGESEANALKYVTQLRSDATLDRNRFPDPALSPKGRQQARAICDVYPRLKGNLIAAQAAVWCAPLTRVLETVKYSMGHTLERVSRDGSSAMLPLEVWPDLQECFPLPTIGSSRDVLEAKFPQRCWDFSRCVSGWNKQEGANATTPEAIQARASAVRRRLLARPEKVILVFGSGLFFLRLVGAPKDEKWENTEVRVYKFTGDTANAAVQRANKEEAVRVLGRTPQSAKELITRWGG